MNQFCHLSHAKHAIAVTCGVALAGDEGHRSIDRRIRAFLNGESHGEDVLGALYGKATGEAVPERLRALLRG